MTGDSRPIKVTAEEDAVLTMYAPLFYLSLEANAIQTKQVAFKRRCSAEHAHARIGRR